VVDTQYEDLLARVMAQGTPKSDRTGTGTRSLFAQSLRYRLDDGYPLVTTKRVHFRSLAVELLWFLRGDSNVGWLREHGVTIWDEWAGEDGDLGPVYGVQWRSWESWKQVPPRLEDPACPDGAFTPAALPEVDPTPNDSGMVGKIFDTATGELLVLNEYRMPRPEGGLGHLRLRAGFPATGYVVDGLTPEALRSGSVRDRFAPTLAGVGRLGSETPESLRWLKGTWNGMMQRCYDASHPAYHRYGGRGVFVHPRWHTLSNFVQDAPKLDGWLLKLEYPDEYTLDKDYYSSNCYGLNTCIWASKKEQAVNTPDVLPVQVVGPDLGHPCFVASVKELSRTLRCSPQLVYKHLESGTPMPSGHSVSWPDLAAGGGPFRYRSYDQVKMVLAQLKHMPDSRRIIISAWNVGELEQMALPPCHSFVQFYVADGRLSCHLYQRSADLFLGVPFNIASYGLLTHMVAQQVGLGVGELVWTGGDCHVYDNHVDQVREQLSRTPHPFPQLRLRRAPSLFDYAYEDVELVGYQHHPALRAPVAV
jgi:thymidylate synthase